MQNKIPEQSTVDSVKLYGEFDSRRVFNEFWKILQTIKFQNNLKFPELNSGNPLLDSIKLNRELNSGGIYSRFGRIVQLFNSIKILNWFCKIVRKIRLEKGLQ